LFYLIKFVKVFWFHLIKFVRVFWSHLIKFVRVFWFHPNLFFGCVLFSYCFLGCFRLVVWVIFLILFCSFFISVSISPSCISLKFSSISLSLFSIFSRSISYILSFSSISFLSHPPRIQISFWLSLSSI